MAGQVMDGEVVGGATGGGVFNAVGVHAAGIGGLQIFRVDDTEVKTSEAADFLAKGMFLFLRGKSFHDFSISAGVGADVLIVFKFIFFTEAVGGGTTAVGEP
jgi:hypothetical protein